MTKQRVVVDTNVLVSALMNARSVSAQALNLLVKHFSFIASTATWDELDRKLHSRKLSAYWDTETRTAFLTQLASRTVFVNVTSQITDCRDADDNKFLSLAVDGQAHLIVSGDQDLRELHPYRGIAILSPAQFLERMQDAPI